MNMRLLPSPAMRCVTPCCAPSPAAVPVMTAAMPMMMPSIVSRVRRKFVRMAVSAVRKTSMMLIR